jgi:phenylalanyl-tRNA synthetase beta chain
MKSAWLGALQIQEVRYEPVEHPSFHPGKCARIWLGERELGIIGELHPLVRDNFDELPPFPILAADCDLDVLTAAVPVRYSVQPVPSYPPVLEDLAFILDESLPAGHVAELIQKEGGRMVTAVQLFDVYRGGQVGEGKKSLAYSITYHDPEGTLTDEQVAKVRQRIIRRLEQELGAKLRG